MLTTNACPRLRVIIPVHPPKVNFLVGFLRSLEWARRHSGSGDCEIVVSATNHLESAYLLRACRSLRLDFDIQMFDVQTYVQDCLMSKMVEDFLRDGVGPAMAAVKKLITLHWAAQQSDAINLCIDADTFCLNWSDDVIRQITSNYEANRYFGASTSGQIYLDINQISLQSLGDVMPPCESTDLDITKIYTWFFDAPTYGGPDIRGFFGRMADKHGSVDSYIASLKWHHFEHLMFMYYRLSRGGELIDYSTMGIASIPEELDGVSIQRIAGRYHYLPVWMAARRYFEGPDAACSSAWPPLLSHFDRM